MTEITAVIMASGRSKRMGRCKLSLPFADSTVLGYFLDNFPQKYFKEVFLVVSESLELPTIASHFKIIKNLKRDLGQSSSIVLATKQAKVNNSLMFFVADQPLLQADTIKQLVHSHKEQPDKIIIPTVAGKRQNPVIFPAKLQGELALLTGDVGGKEVIVNHQNDISFIAFDDKKQQFKDIDVEEDYLDLLSDINRGDRI